MTRTVLTTGANSGLGLAIALEAARRGFRSVGSVRSAAKADVLRQAAAEAGVKVETVQLDVSDAARCQEVIADVRPDDLVNNAGYALTGAIEDVGDEEARAILETMVVAPMRLARLAVPHMREQGHGTIVNMSSMLGLSTLPLNGWYAATKYALESLTDALRMELGGTGIRVVLIEPGVFATSIADEVGDDLTRRGASRYESAYRRAHDVVQQGQRFAGDPKKVAKVTVDAIASGRPRARYLIGLDAHLLTLTTRIVPTPLRDFVTRKSLGL